MTMTLLRRAVLTELRRRKMTKYRLAELSGVDAQIIYHWLRGEQGILEQNLVPILKALGLGIVATRPLPPPEEEPALPAEATDNPPQEPAP